MPERERRWNGWGFAGETVPVPEPARAWLSEKVGTGDPLPAVGEDEITVPPPRPLPALPATTSTERGVRLRNACGHSFPDLVALRTGRVAAFPDGVCFPETAQQVVGVLEAAASAGLAVIPRGGGTSVVGGVTVEDAGRPTVVLALGRLRGLVALDTESQLASFGAGTLGPEVEADLAAHGLRLGHEPQSFELSSVGGWIASRSAGQRSTGIGRIEDLLAGGQVATERGLWRLAAQPASAAGPELRRLVTGSEGRLGVITEATLRVRPRPEAEDGVAVLLPSFSAGFELARALLQSHVPIEVLRVSDPDETAFAMALTRLPGLAAAASRVVFGLRRYRHGCLLLLGWAGDAQGVGLARNTAARTWREAGGLALGRSGWRRWLADRFRHPYLRDELLSAGWGADTLETAAPWSSLGEVYAAVREGMRHAAEAARFKVAVLCHLSHAYRDGASLYFTFMWPLRKGGEVAQWSTLKIAATEAILATGGTISHHHGVGRMHAGYLEREIGREGAAALTALASALDPHGILNPGVLLPRTPGWWEG